MFLCCCENICFAFDLKIYNKNVISGTPFTTLQSFLPLLPKSVRTAYADVITKLYGIARFPVLNF